MYDKKIATEYRFVEADNGPEFVRKVRYESKDITARGGKIFGAPYQVTPLPGGEGAKVLYTCLISWQPTEPEAEEDDEKEEVNIEEKVPEFETPKNVNLCPKCNGPLPKNAKTHLKCGWRAE